MRDCQGPFSWLPNLLLVGISFTSDRCSLPTFLYYSCHCQPFPSFSLALNKFREQKSKLLLWEKTCWSWSVVLFFNVFNWRIIALQNFVAFCHTSIRISHRYTHVPSLPDLPPISLPIPPFSLSQRPCLSSLSHTAIPIGYLFCIWYCKFPWWFLHTSHPLPPPLPTVSIGWFSMFLHCCPANKLISAIFLDSIHTC